jgi:hypothetical protein
LQLLANSAAGRTFYTVASDHYNCPVGSHTHNIPLPAERAKELEQTLGLMVNIGYLKMEELPGILRLADTPGAVIYAPLGDTPVDPDVVIFSGSPREIMLVQARPPDVHGAARGDGARSGDEHGLHRQSRLHGTRRRRDVCSRGGTGSGKRGG